MLLLDKVKEALEGATLPREDYIVAAEGSEGWVLVVFDHCIPGLEGRRALERAGLDVVELDGWRAVKVRE